MSLFIVLFSLFLSLFVILTCLETNATTLVGGLGIIRDGSLGSFVLCPPFFLTCFHFFFKFPFSEAFVSLPDSRAGKPQNTTQHGSRKTRWLEAPRTVDWLGFAWLVGQGSGGFGLVVLFYFFSFLSLYRDGIFF